MSSGGGGQASDPNASAGSGVMQGAMAGSSLGPYGAMAGATIGLIGGLQQANASKVQGAWEKERAKTNAMLIDMQKRDILENAQDEASQYENEVASMISTQRTSFLAQGIDADTGTAKQIQDQTREIGDQDIKAIKNNAWKQAWGLDIEKDSVLERGEMRQEQMNSQAKSKVISSGLNAINSGINIYNSY